MLCCYILDAEFCYSRRKSVGSKVFLQLAGRIGRQAEDQKLCGWSSVQKAFLRTSGSFACLIVPFNGGLGSGEAAPKSKASSFLRQLVYLASHV